MCPSYEDMSWGRIELGLSRVKLLPGHFRLSPEDLHKTLHPDLKGSSAPFVEPEETSVWVSYRPTNKTR